MVEVKSYKIEGSDTYFVKLVLDGDKILNTECNCTWGQNNKDAWKEGKTVCKHTQQAIRQLNIDKKYQQKKNGN